ncbi:MAG: DUF456 domain-containing protein [Chloroflexi bacterium]|nr:DUF456 domain-containing protein [Chloroflexota bacterium]
MVSLDDILIGLINGILFVVMLVGLFGLIIPIFPGGVVIWLASLVYGLLRGFEGVGIGIFALITIFMIIGSVADNIVMGKVARDKGASWIAIALGLIAGISGTILFPPFGGIFGAPVVLFFVEFIRLTNFKKAASITGGLIIGWGWSVVIRFVLGVGMIIMWGFWVWTNSV